MHHLQMFSSSVSLAINLDCMNIISMLNIFIIEKYA